MSTLLFANNAQTTLAGPISAGALSVNLAAGTGSEFANPGVGQYFVLTFTDAATGLLHEIVSVTARVGDTLTVVRAQEGTTARSWSAGDIAGNWWTAGSAATMVQVQTLQTQPGNYAVDTGTVNNIQIVLNPSPATLATIAGAPIRVLVKNTNTGATILTIAGLSATIVFAQSGSTASLPSGAVVAGQIYEFTYVPSVGFEVATAKVLLATANTWATTQTIANNTWWSGNNTSGASQPLIGMDSANETTLFAGPSGAAAWHVVNSTGSTNLMYLSSAGILHVLAGIFADTGNIGTNGNVNAVGSVNAGTAGITSQSGSTGTGNQFRAPILADFASGSNATGWWTTFPSFGLTSSNAFMVQGGSILAPGNNSGAVYPLPRSFPNVCVSVLISYGGAVPPTQGAIGAQPSGPANFIALNSATGGGVNGCNYIAVGW